MALATEVLSVLDNKEAPITKRLKLADNTFYSSELPLQHKESFLLVWVLKNSKDNSECWNLFNKWLSSEQFKELSRNDICNNEISKVVELILKRLKDVSNIPVDQRKLILGSSQLLLSCPVFQQYFRYDVETYCKLIANIVNQIDNPEYYTKLIKNENFFQRNIIIHEKFHKCFLDIIIPNFVDVLKRFDKDELVFEQTSSIIQKFFFSKNFKSYETFLDQFFETTIKSEKAVIPKALLKYLAVSYNFEASGTFKLLFSSFCNSYNNFEYNFKLFVVLLQMIGFDLEKKFNINKISKLKIPEVKLSKSLLIFNELLGVFVKQKNTLDFKLNDVNFSDSLKDILKTLINFKKPCSVIYNIFINTITIDPLIIESVISKLIPYVMLANNNNFQAEYENLVIAIFEVFSKLHRVQNLISKMIPTLKRVLDGENYSENVIKFVGLDDLEYTSATQYKIEYIFPSSVLSFYSKCVANLASWQVMNLFKTLLHYLEATITELPNIHDEPNKLIYVEILNLLTCWLLSSVRVAEHTISTTIVNNFVKSLGQLRDLLSKFGTSLLHREHNLILMRVFLNICYHWGEVYVILRYYSLNNEVNLKLTMDNNYSYCNITYLHSYMTANQWCLISERITNFGEKPCKLLMQKLAIQKLRAILLFEPNQSEEVIQDVVKIVSSNLEDNYKTVIQDKYIVNHLLSKMDQTSIKLLAESLIKDYIKMGTDINSRLILDSQILINALNYVVLLKINRFFKQKRKQGDATMKTSLSTKIFSVIEEDIFLSSCNAKNKECVDALKIIFNSSTHEKSEIVVPDKMKDCLDLLKKFPIIFSSDDVQQIVLIYLFSLHKDVCSLAQSELVKTCIESIIIGVLQHTKLRLLDIFEANILSNHIIINFERYQLVFSLFIDNAYKHGVCIKKLEPSISDIAENLGYERQLNCALIVLDAVNKIKKVKIPAEIKSLTMEHKSLICNQIVKLVQNGCNDYLIEAFAYVLKKYISKNENNCLEVLLNQLDAYVNFALKNIWEKNVKGCIDLFTTILHNKTKINNIEEDFCIKVWDGCKSCTIDLHNVEDYENLVVLIFESFPNEKFSHLTTDLLSFTMISINTNDYSAIRKYLKTWKSILGCNFNPIKLNIWEQSLASLVEKLSSFLQVLDYNEELLKNIIEFKVQIILTNHLHLSSSLVDMLILNVSLLWMAHSEHFFVTFNLSINLMTSLIKSRKPLIMDRLAPYLQQYRLLLRKLCIKSNADANLEPSQIQQLSDCAHQLEKLTRILVACQKDLARISLYLIADILEQYEEITIYPNVKIHLNNCVYGLISLCDQHAVSYLMRALSSASTEIFKGLYENYKKYYRFTGKV